MRSIMRHSDAIRSFNFAKLSPCSNFSLEGVSFQLIQLPGYNKHFDDLQSEFIVTAQQQPQPKQQNNHNCSWVETK